MRESLVNLNIGRVDSSEAALGGGGDAGKPSSVPVEFDLIRGLGSHLGEGAFNRLRGRSCPDISSLEQLLQRNVRRFRGGLVIKAQRLCVSLNSRLESNKEEEKIRARDVTSC